LTHKKWTVENNVRSRKKVIILREGARGHLQKTPGPLPQTPSPNPICNIKEIEALVLDFPEI